MKQSKVKSVYYDTIKNVKVFIDSIKDTKKGPYIHYRQLNSETWGRKSENDFDMRFKKLNEVFELKHNKLVKEKQDVSIKYTNIIYVDFYLKQIQNK